MSLAERVRGQRVLLFGSEKARARALPRPLEPASLDAYAPDALPARASFDVALVLEWSDAAELIALARAAHEAVRPGGIVGFLGPARDGLLAGMLRRRPKVILDDLCEALLSAGLSDIRVEAEGESAQRRLVFGIAGS